MQHYVCGGDDDGCAREARRRYHERLDAHGEDVDPRIVEHESVRAWYEGQRCTVHGSTTTRAGRS